MVPTGRPATTTGTDNNSTSTIEPFLRVRLARAWMRSPRREGVAVCLFASLIDRDKAVEFASDGFVLGVSEQLLGGGIPRHDHVVQALRHDGHRAVLDE